MTPEERLRRAIDARTTSVEPSEDGRERIEERLAQHGRQRDRHRIAIAIGSAAALVAVVAGTLAVTGDDDDGAVSGQPSTTSTSTTTEATTTTTERTTTTTAFAPTVDPAGPVWPRVDTAQRFDDPVALTLSFAVDFLGMVDPVVGAFQPGDARSGEVPVQPIATGPVTTVIVRQLEDDTWFVLGAATADIRLDSPSAGATIECPVRLTGEALAFEGTVAVSVRADGADEPIGTGFVTGGGGPAAPFDGTVPCDAAGLGDPPRYGALVLSTEGGEDGRLWRATVIRIALP